MFKKILILIAALAVIQGCSSRPFIYEKKGLTYDQIDYGFDIKTFDGGDGIGKIAYIDEGKGEKTILMIHGRISYSKIFQSQINALKEKYRVIAIDLPGYGKSEFNDKLPYSGLLHTQAILAFAKSLKLDNIILAGHSYGGALAVVVAGLNQLDVKKVVLAAPGGLQDYSDEDFKIMSENLSFFTTENYDPDHFINAWDTYAVSNHTVQTDNTLREYLGLIFSKNIENTYKTRNKIEISGIQMKSKVISFFKAIQAPILIVAGNKDQTVPSLYPTTGQKPDAKDFFESVAKLNPNASLILLQNCGHMIPVEQPEAFTKAMEDFIAK